MANFRTAVSGLCLLSAVCLSGCVGVVDAVSVAGGAAGFVNNTRQAIRANMDARCERWFSTEVGFGLATRMAKGLNQSPPDADKFHIIQADTNEYCVNAWKFPGGGADAQVMHNTDVVQQMISGS